jgi:hypothetical protein
MKTSLREAKIFVKVKRISKVIFWASVLAFSHWVSHGTIWIWIVGFALTVWLSEISDKCEEIVFWEKVKEDDKRSRNFREVEDVRETEERKIDQERRRNEVLEIHRLRRKTRK